MVFSYSTNAFVKYSLSEAVKLIAQTGFRGVEIMCDRPHLYPPDANSQDLEKFRQLLENLKLTITNLQITSEAPQDKAMVQIWSESIEWLMR